MKSFSPALAIREFAPGCGSACGNCTDNGVYPDALILGSDCSFACSTFSDSDASGTIAAASCFTDALRSRLYVHSNQAATPASAIAVHHILLIPMLSGRLLLPVVPGDSDPCFYLFAGDDQILFQLSVRLLESGDDKGALRELDSVAAEHHPAAQR